MYYAQTNADAVVVAITQTVGPVQAPHMIPVAGYDVHLLGWSWDGISFIAPVPVAEPRYITVGAFYDRFGSAKYAILASTSPAVQALIADGSVRRYIDLDNADLFAGLQALQAAGFAIDASAIINGAIQPDERP